MLTKPWLNCNLIMLLCYGSDVRPLDTVGADEPYCQTNDHTDTDNEPHCGLCSLTNVLYNILPITMHLAERISHKSSQKKKRKCVNKI